VAGEDLSRNFSPDQETIPLRLQAGANLLLLKICCQEGSFEFSARLRARDGSTVQGLRESLDPEDMLRASRSGASTSPELLEEHNARNFFADSIASSGSVADKFRLALLLALDQIEDPTQRSDQELLRQVVEELPDFSPARYLLAFTRIRSASRSEEREENQRRQDYLQLLQHDPSHVEALRSLAELELSMNGSVERGEALLDRALRINRDFRLGQLMLATVYSQQRLNSLAEQAVVSAASPDAKGRRAPLALHALLHIRIDQRAWPEAIEIAKRVLAEDYGPTSIREAADLYLRIGKTDQAIATLEDAELKLPYMEFAAKTLARLYQVQGDLQPSLTALGRWLPKCPDDDDALVSLATLHGLLGQEDQRIELLRSALALNPNRKTERRLLEFLEADELPFYAGYQQKYEISSDGDPGPPADWAEANNPYYYLLHQVVVRAYRNGTRSTYQHDIIQVLNEKGAQDLSQYYVQHFQGEQRARLLVARVHRADGQTLSPEINLSFVRFPPLAVGDRIELQSRVDDLAPSFFGDYFGLLHRFASSDGAPVNRSVLTLILDPGRQYRLQPANGAPTGITSQDDQGREIHRFEMLAIGRREVESRGPAWTETEALLRVTTYADWNQFSTWWGNLIRRQSEVSPAMRAKVRDLVAGLSTDREKIDAIYRFVTTNIRYKAWEFGVHGYKPYSTPVIFERRHGDCKDRPCCSIRCSERSASRPSRC